MAHGLTIGQVAKTTGVPAKTIRYYEEIGVLPAAGRSLAGYRQYGHSDVARLHFVARARALGLPLRQLGALMSALNGGSSTSFRPRLLTLVRRQLAAVERQARDLELLREQLERAADRIRSADRRRRVGPCRCLDRDDGRRRRTRHRS